MEVVASAVPNSPLSSLLASQRPKSSSSSTFISNVSNRMNEDRGKVNVNNLSSSSLLKQSITINDDSPKRPYSRESQKGVKETDGKNSKNLCLHQLTL